MKSKQKQPNVRFYRLKSPRSAKIVGGTANLTAPILFMAFWLAVATAFVVAFAVLDIFSGVGLVIWAVFMYGIGIVLIAFPLAKFIKERGLRQRNRALLQNCFLTDGKVLSSWVESEKKPFWNERTFRVHIQYEYYDMDYVKRQDECVSAYIVSLRTERTHWDEEHQFTPPYFYKGQNLMVAFTHEQSAVLSQWKLEQEDEETFAHAEEERAQKCFYRLSGNTVAVRSTRPPKIGKIAAACALLTVIAVLWTALSLFSLGPSLFASYSGMSLVIHILSVAVPLSATVVLMTLALRFGVPALRVWSAYRRIQKNAPSYVFGRLFADERTYRKGQKTRIVYCYIDGNGVPHRERASKLLYGNKAKGGKSRVLIAYDDKSSVIIDTYTLAKNTSAKEENDEDETVTDI